MKRSRFSDEQIIGILKEHQASMTASDLVRPRQ
jgi:putative transposase